MFTIAYEDTKNKYPHVVGIERLTIRSRRPRAKKGVGSPICEFQVANPNIRRKYISGVMMSYSKSLNVTKNYNGRYLPKIYATFHVGAEWEIDDLDWTGLRNSIIGALSTNLPPYSHLGIDFPQQEFRITASMLHDEMNVRIRSK